MKQRNAEENVNFSKVLSQNLYKKYKKQIFVCFFLIFIKKTFKLCKMVKINNNNKKQTNLMLIKTTLKKKA